LRDKTFAEWSFMFVAKYGWQQQDEEVVTTLKIHLFFAGPTKPNNIVVQFPLPFFSFRVQTTNKQATSRAG